MRTRTLFFVAVLLVFALSAGAQDYHAELRGSNEVPPCDPDATGTADVTLIGTTVNYSITIDNFATAPPIAQHIHQGVAGVNGPIVVNFPGVWTCAAGPAPPCSLVGSTTTSQATADAIRANPAGFYVNVHTSDCPGGVARGQLVPSGIIPTASTLGLVALALMLAVAGMIYVRRA